MAIFERPFRSIEELYETRLAELEKMYRSGIDLAVAAAADYCAVHDIVAPAWLTKASADLHCRQLRSDTPHKRGRASSPLARYRQDGIDLVRFEEVNQARQHQKEYRQQIKELLALPATPRELPQRRERSLAEMKKMVEWLGSTFERAFECVSMSLEGSEAAGGPDSIKQSYFRVGKNNKDPIKAQRYHVLEIHFLHKLGLKNPADKRQVRKFVPLYDLTLR